MPALPTFATLPTRLTPPRDLRRVRPRPKRRRLDWPAHLVSLAVLLLVYLAGYSGGRDAALSRVAAPLSPAATQLGSAANHPAYHPNLKP
jgi:heme A synthase